MTVQNQVARALEIARRIGAERPGPARSERQTDRLRGAIEAAPLVALGPDSTDQTERARNPFPFQMEYRWPTDGQWRRCGDARTLDEAQQFARTTCLPVRVRHNGAVIWDETRD